MVDVHVLTPEAATGTEINDKPAMARTRTLRIDIDLGFKETYPTAALCFVQASHI